MTVLILAGPANASVTVVSAELARRGVPVVRIDPQDRGVDVEVAVRTGSPRWTGTLGCGVTGATRLELAEVRSVWCPAEQRTGWHRHWWGQMLAGLDVVWVNHPHAATNAGLAAQVPAAARAGLRVPDTVLTSRRTRREHRYVPTEIVVQDARVAQTGGPARGRAPGMAPGPGSRVPAGAAGGREDRAAHPTTRWLFGRGQMLQRPIEGPTREVRVVAIGAVVHAALTDRHTDPPPAELPGAPGPGRTARLPSLPRPRAAGPPGDRPDRRHRAGGAGDACAGIERPGYTSEALAVPDDVEAGVRQMLAGLGLTYAVCSFALDAADRWWFLRLDPVAELALIEFGTGLPLTEAMATCLERGRHVA